MRSTLRCENPKDIEYTITMTATCEYWGNLKNTLDTSYNSLEFRNILNDILSQAHEVYFSKKTDS